MKILAKIGSTRSVTDNKTEKSFDRRDGPLIAMVVCIAGFLAGFGALSTVSAAEALKVHGIFRSNMVIQRGKPITVWGWAPAGKEVEVTFGSVSEKAKAAGDEGRWEAVFPAEEASTKAQSLTVNAGD